MKILRNALEAAQRAAGVQHGPRPGDAVLNMEREENGPYLQATMSYPDGRSYTVDLREGREAEAHGVPDQVLHEMQVFMSPPPGLALPDAHADARQAAADRMGEIIASKPKDAGLEF